MQHVIRRYCQGCRRDRPFEREGISHLFHLIVSVVTAGLWLPIWLALFLYHSAFTRYRCRDCGRWI